MLYVMAQKSDEVRNLFNICYNHSHLSNYMITKLYFTTHFCQSLHNHKYKGETATHRPLHSTTSYIVHLLHDISLAGDATVLEYIHYLKRLYTPLQISLSTP